MFQHVEDPSALLILERYADSEAVETHKRSGHHGELVVDRIVPMLEDRQVEVLGPGE